MKNVKIWLVLFAVMLTAGTVGSGFVLQKPESSIVEIMRDGAVLYRCDLPVFRFFCFRDA